MTGNGARKYNLDTIRQLLLAAFNPEELRRFCHDRPDTEHRTIGTRVSRQAAKETTRWSTCRGKMRLLFVPGSAGE
jgi:hypothetical protein